MPASTDSIYHGSHEYSTFSASTIEATQLHSNYRNAFCFFCRWSSSLILHPVGPFRCIWDLFVMLVLIYTSIEIPYALSFGQSSKSFNYIGLFVDCFLMLDIILNFHTAYFDKYDNLRIVTNKKHICKKYFFGWFWIDFVTCIPFQLFNPAQDGNGALVWFKVLRIFRLLRILKILRFLKMMRIFDGFMKQFVMREFIIVMKIIKIVFLMVLVAHYAACLWWYIGENTDKSWIDTHGIRHKDTFTKYSYSWYWSVVTLFTTGYGDISATNSAEQWTCSICILIGTCFFAYFVGTLTAIITEGDKIQSYQTDKIEEAQSFCEKKKLPKELTRAILTHIRYHATYNYVFDESELLGLLPTYLQHDIHSFVARQFLLQLKIFQNEYIHLPDFIIGLIAVKCKSISCNQSYKLYDIGDMAKEIYIQRTGQSVMQNKNGEFIRELTRGSVCGEYSSFLFKRRITKVQCETWSEFYSIDIDDIKQILNAYFPKSSQSKWKQIKKYLKGSYKHNKEHSVEINHYNTFNDGSNSLHKESSSIIRSYATQDSVHLFNNTKKKLRVFIPSEHTNISVHTPVPPIFESENDDHHDSDYSYEIAALHPENRKKNLHKSKSKASVTGMAAKLQMRSNSEIRDSMVVAHHQKYMKSKQNATVDSPETKLIEIEETKVGQFKSLSSSLNEFEDSECSLFSSDASDNDNRETKVLNRKKKRKIKRKKHRLKHIANKTYQQNNVQTTNKIYQQNIGSPKNIHRQPSIEDSLTSQLLEALMAKALSTMRDQNSFELADLNVDVDRKPVDINANSVEAFESNNIPIRSTKMLSMIKSGSIDDDHDT